MLFQCFFCFFYVSLLLTMDYVLFYGTYSIKTKKNKKNIRHKIFLRKLNDICNRFKHAGFSRNKVMKLAIENIVKDFSSFSHVFISKYECLKMLFL